MFYKVPNTPHYTKNEFFHQRFLQYIWPNPLKTADFVIFTEKNPSRKTSIFVQYLSLRKKCPYLKLFWPVFFHIRTEYGEIRNVSPYSVQMWENTDQNNSKYGHFLRFYAVSDFKNIKDKRCKRFPTVKKLLNSLKLHLYCQGVVIID